jgi:hypothetical protein
MDVSRQYDGHAPPPNVRRRSRHGLPLAIRGGTVAAYVYEIALLVWLDKTA